MENIKNKSNVNIGTEITCPKCHKIMVRCIKNIRTGDTISGEFFRSVNASIVHGARIICPFDGSAYIRPGMGAHIEEYGWTW